ncbi:TlpA disulfide reductase family protein [Parabacteroides pacaensis]|uniref:TlpA disulfide reductase family protein n=1 Tax=Parabacteroides pacaensis TaxID=2086575 RepID=UPI000D0E7762|nr:TlpA disulfide reductase family protein [Parabacteroides pacaensis]
MKFISTPLLLVISILLLLFSACNNTSHYTVKGVVSGADGQIMYFENVGVSSVEIIDSIKLGASGKFKISHPSPEFPDFYRLRLNNQLINIGIDSTETVVITADAGTFATSYTIEGSENSKALKDITLAQLDANQEIRKLRKQYEKKEIPDSLYRSKIIAASEAYKEVAKKYIYSAPMSLAAYFALFQQIDGLLFFDLYDLTDSKAFGAVATSFDHFYPENPRSKQLHNLAMQSMKVIRSQRTPKELGIETKEVNFFDVALPNIYGEIEKLSSLVKNKVVILNFTAYQTEWSPALNMTLGSIYTKYHPEGLEIYQVSLDSDLHFWKNAASNLPWTCVNDPQSVYSEIAGMYNVRQLPAIFILDKKGNLAKRVENIKNLESDVKSLL